MAVWGKSGHWSRIIGGQFDARLRKVRELRGVSALSKFYTGMRSGALFRHKQI